MKHRICRWSLLCVLFWICLGYALIAHAQLEVEVLIDPDIRKISLDKPVEISLIARVSEANVSFLWELDGPGQLLGEKTNSGILYLPPNNIEGATKTLFVKLHIENSKGETTTKSLSLTLVAVKPTPLPAAIEKDIFHPIVISLTERDIASIGQQIWMNEGSGNAENLIVWQEHEHFVSLGIGHFIWYPADKKGPFEESFPPLLAFFQEQGVKLPTWLQAPGACPWTNRDEFLQAKEGPEFKELQILLTETVPLQIQFMIRRLELALPKMLKSLKSDEQRASVQQQFYQMARTPEGVYALVDYVNFKGEGLALSERYEGHGWGLLQVLLEMQDVSDDPVIEFADSAEKVLTLRVQNAPENVDESRWLPGWKNRVETYRQPFSDSMSRAETTPSAPSPSPTPAPQELTILSDPAIETIYVLEEQKTTEIILMAQAEKTDAEFEWTLSGPGALEGDITSSIVLYIMPESLTQRVGQAKISVTAKDSEGKSASAEMTINLMSSVTSESTPVPAVTVTPSLSSAVLESREQFNFAPVSAGTHVISKYLQQYLRFLDREHVLIPEDFFVQKHEVTVGQFREYVNSLNEEQQKQIGTRWEKDRAGKRYADERPVENVSWWVATAYTEWASEKTQWDLRLPTLEQWAAACVVYPGFAPVLTTPDDQPLSAVRQEVDHLLGNLREWSATACEDGGQFLIGENYMSDVSDPSSIGRKQCAALSERWSGIGFRLIRILTPEN